MTSGRSGDGLLGCRLADERHRDLRIGEHFDQRVACTDSGDTPGRMRQFTFARAICGSALLAWPPSSSVATHVVRIIAL